MQGVLSSDCKVLARLFPYKGEAPLGATMIIFLLLVLFLNLHLCPFASAEGCVMQRDDMAELYFTSVFSACPRPAVGRIGAEFRSADTENLRLA